MRALRSNRKRQARSMNSDTESHDQDDIGCLEAIEAFYSYLDGELSDPEAIQDFEHHMSHCRSCFSRAEVEKLLNKRMRDSGVSKAPDDLRDRVRRLMDEF
jgi:anti-sigma factor (TIGR02949 family)